MSAFGFLIIIVAFAFLWLVVVRPQKRRQSEQQQMLKQLRVGDQVLTAGGIYGEITSLRDDEATVEIAPQLEVRVARRAIAGVVAREEVEEAEAEPAEETETEAEGEVAAAPGEAPGDEERGYPSSGT